MKSIVSQVVFEQRKVNREAYKELSEEFYQDGCLVCAENTRGCLDAHHAFPENKDFSVFEARDGNYSKEELKAELDKCICLCKNCHYKVHLNKIKLEDYTDIEYYRKFPKQNIKPTAAIKKPKPANKKRTRNPKNVSPDSLSYFVHLLNSSLKEK